MRKVQKEELKNNFVNFLLTSELFSQRRSEKVRDICRGDLHLVAWDGSVFLVYVL